jgi:DNA replication protein DnaC
VTTFDISRFQKKTEPTGQYERQLHRLRSEHKEVVCIEKAVRGAVENLRHKRCTSFVIYGEPQSGKTEMMICLTAKLLDDG